MKGLNVELSSAMLALVPVVAAIMQALKRVIAIQQIPQGVGFFVKELLPFISMIIAFLLLRYQAVPEPLLPAIIIGLTACGGYDLLKGKKLKL